MATRVQGVSATWGGTALSEVTGIEFDIQRGLPLNRGTAAAWTLSLGTVAVEALANNALPTSEYGKRKVFKVVYKDESNSEQTLWESDCIYQGLTIQQPLNDVMKFAFTFRVMDTNNAGSYPA